MTNSARQIADAFISARRAARPLPEFPGTLPTTLDNAYRVQEQAIALRGEDIGGWKIGRIPAARVEEFGAERLAGPIYRNLIWPADQAEERVVPAYAGGFAAVEAEFVYRISANAPPDKTVWLREEAEELVAGLHIGVELAGSPLASINAIGPIAVVCDFGNNHGLILGPEIPDWRARRDEDLTAETFIDGRSIGRASASAVLGGPMSSLLFLLEHLAARGRPLRAGQLVSTGAVTGVHDIDIGQHARIKFGPFGEIRCVALKAEAMEIDQTVAHS